MVSKFHRYCGHILPDRGLVSKQAYRTIDLKTVLRSAIKRDMAGPLETRYRQSPEGIMLTSKTRDSHKSGECT